MTQMKIESIELYKGKTYCVLLEDDSRLYINADLVAACGLQAGCDYPLAELARVQKLSHLRRAKERALYLLEYRDHSYAELYGKLEKNYGEDIAAEISDKMAELGFVDDEKYARKLAASLIEGKRFGMRKVRYELLTKGLDRDLVDEVLAEYEDFDPCEKIAELIERKYARYLTDRKGVQKVINALMRMGHTYSDIKAVIEEYTDRIDEENEE